MYSFQEHQRLPETKYLYGATIIIGTSRAIVVMFCDSDARTLAEGIMALVDPTLRALYDLKVCMSSSLTGGLSLSTIK